MFFIYLFVFILIVITPFLVKTGFWIFTEDDIESIVLLCASIAGFVLYRMRDYQLFENLNARIKLQRLFTRAQKNLSESYSYIGQANRKTDIMRDLFSDLSHATEEDYDEIVRGAMNSLAYDRFCLRFIDLKQKKAHHKIHLTKDFGYLPDKIFCKQTVSHSYLHKDVLFVYADIKDENIRTCLALPRNEKSKNDTDFFKVLTAYFAMAYVFQKNSLHKKNK